MKFESVVKVVLSSLLLIYVLSPTAYAEAKDLNGDQKYIDFEKNLQEQVLDKKNSKKLKLKSGAGYHITKNQLKVLAGNYFTKYSLTLGRTEVINKITRLITKINPSPRGSASPKDLAQKIYSVSAAYGIDPILFTAKIWQESGYFNVDVVAKGGDTGLTQMTGNGLNENRAQHKKINSTTLEVKQVGQTLAELAMGHLRNNKTTNDWINWVILKSNKEQKSTLVRSVDYSLMSGASLFKTYLAVKNGNYKSAITQYNGGGVKNYYGMIIKKENQVQLAKLNVPEDLKYTLGAVCEIANSNRGCESLINEIL